MPNMRVSDKPPNSYQTRPNTLTATQYVPTTVPNRIYDASVADIADAADASNA